MDYQLIVWLAGIGDRAGMTTVSARQTHSLKTGPYRQTTSWLVYEAEGIDANGLHTATLWREIPRGWDVIETDHD